MSISSDLIKNALKLKPFERLMFIQTLNKSLDIPDKYIDDQWISEVLDRINAYENGNLKTIGLEEFKKQ